MAQFIVGLRGESEALCAFNRACKCNRWSICLLKNFVHETLNVTKPPFLQNPHSEDGSQ